MESNNIERKMKNMKTEINYNNTIMRNSIEVNQNKTTVKRQKKMKNQNRT